MSNRNPALSVIVPARNAEALLDRALPVWRGAGRGERGAYRRRRRFDGRDRGRGRALRRPRSSGSTVRGARRRPGMPGARAGRGDILLSWTPTSALRSASRTSSSGPSAKIPAWTPSSAPMMIGPPKGISCPSSRTSFTIMSIKTPMKRPGRLGRLRRRQEGGVPRKSGASRKPTPGLLSRTWNSATG